MRCKSSGLQGFFFFFQVVSGAEIRPHSQWNLGDFFPNLVNKFLSQLKMIFNCSILCEIQTLLFEMMFEFDFKFLFNDS